MMGFFGGSKSTKKSTETSQAPTPVPVTEAPPPADDLFGGLAVTKPRRSRKGKEEEAPPAQEPTSQAASGGGLSRSKKKATVAASHVDKTAEVADKVLTRARLHRFYQEYRPEKLASLDLALATYSGREAEMFQALEAKYGPEPTGPLDLPEGHPYLQEHPQEAAAVVESQPDGGAWGSDPPASADDGAWGAGGDWGGEPTTTTQGGFGEPGGFGGGGFDTPEAVGFGADSGWGDGAEGAVGFTDAGFGEPIDPEERATSTAVAPTSSFLQPEVAKTEAVDEPVYSTPSHHSDEEDETLNERHRRELTTAKANVSEFERRLSALLRSIADGISGRRKALAEFEAAEAQIDVLVLNERFEEADELNSKLPVLSEGILQRDRATAKILLTGKDAHTDLLDSLRHLADVYRTQEEELKSNQREEERRTTNYLMETTSRIEQLSEKVQADLDRASRALSHSEQEVQNLQRRQQKTQAKIEEQTRTLRTQREKNEMVRSSLATEIKELEVKLAAKRKRLAEADSELVSIDEKMNIIKDEYSTTLRDVGNLIDEERARMETHKRAVEALTAEEQRVREEAADFAEEKRSMTFQMETYSSRIECYRLLAEDLSTRQIDSVSRFYETTIRRAFHSREKGTNFLVPVPQSVLDNSADVSRLNDHESNSSGSSAQSGGGLNSGMDALKRKEHDLLNARSTIVSTEAQLSATLLSLQNIESQLPLLEAAKKSAAQSKQYREAKAKAEEIAAVTKAKEEQEATLGELRARKQEAESDVIILEQAVAEEKRAAKGRVAKFAEAYSETLAHCHKVAANTLLLITAIGNMDETSAVEEFVDSAEVVNGSLSSPDATVRRTVTDIDKLYVAGHDPALPCDFVQATRACLESLEEELVAVYPEAAATIAAIRSSDLVTVPRPPTPAEAFEEAAVAPTTEAPISRTHSDVAPVNGADDWGVEPSNPPADGWGAPEVVGDDGGWGVAATDGFEPSPQEVFDVEAARSTIQELEAKLEEAVAADDFDACEALQADIDRLEAEIVAAESF